MSTRINAPRGALLFGIIWLMGIGAPISAWAQFEEDPDYMEEERQHEPEPAREGLTLKLSTGVAVAALLYREGDSRSYGGFGGINIGVGGFFSPDIALLLKGSAVTFGFSRTFDLGVIAHVGPAIQYWLIDWLHLELGVGLGVNWIDYRNGPRDVDLGPAAVGGLGLSLHSGERSTLGLYAEVSSVMNVDPTLTGQIGVMWQYY